MFCVVLTRPVSLSIQGKRAKCESTLVRKQPFHGNALKLHVMVVNARCFSITYSAELWFSG